MIAEYIYKAFGLTIRSEIDCPELFPHQGKADVEIKLGNVSNSIENPLFTGVRFQAKEREFLLTVDGIARYYIIDGNSITIDIYPNANLAEVRLFLLGSAFGALLHQRGVLPFHGSSVKIGSGAIILSGLSGAGKSTLASAFRSKGYKILSDDISAISVSDNGSPFVQPGYPQVKLWSDSITQLGDNPKKYAKVRAELEKHKVPIISDFYETPLPLTKIFILASSNLGELKIEQIKGVEKFSLLKTHTYRFNFVSGKEMNESHFKTFEILARKVDVFKVFRPAGKFCFDELINLVLNG